MSLENQFSEFWHSVKHRPCFDNDCWSVWLFCCLLDLCDTLPLHHRRRRRRHKEEFHCQNTSIDITHHYQDFMMLPPTIGERKIPLSKYFQKEVLIEN